MGLSFHYTGRLNTAASLPELIREAEDIATIFGWKYTIFETEFPAGGLDSDSYDDNLYGICLSPAECEPFFLSFLSNGKMGTPITLQFYGDDAGEKDREYRHWVSVKTQYAGPDVHIKLIKLFRYIGGKYLLNVAVNDEGKYWETDDADLLHATFKRYRTLIDGFATAIESFPVGEDEDIETYLMRMAEYVKRREG